MVGGSDPAEYVQYQSKSGQKNTIKRPRYGIIFESAGMHAFNGTLPSGYTLDDILVYERTYLNTSILTNWYFGDIKYLGRLRCRYYEGDIMNPPELILYTIKENGDKYEDLDELFKRHVMKKILITGLHLAISVVSDLFLAKSIIRFAKLGITAKEVVREVIISALQNSKNVEYDKDIANTILDSTPIVSPIKGTIELINDSNKLNLIGKELVDSYKRINNKY